MSGPVIVTIDSRSSVPRNPYPAQPPGLKSTADRRILPAIPVPDPKYGEEINAAVILQPGQHATEAELQNHCRAQLSAFEIPKKIYFLDRFPRTAKGDGDRRALARAL